MMNPMVSVVMITYGHEKFIVDAVKGVFFQDYNGPIELIIANDKSPDDTDLVLTTFLENTIIPEHIQVDYICHDSNKGMKENFSWALKRASGKYIAICEGDDFWTSPLKLQKQVDFLESNPDFSLCFTNVSTQNASGEIIKERSIPESRYDKDVFTQDDMVIFAPTLSRVFKNVIDKDSTLTFSGDSMQLVYLSTFGKIKYLDIVTGVYRIHAGGVWSMQSELKQKFMFTNSRIDCLQIINVKNQHRFLRDILKNFWYLKCIHTEESTKELVDLITKYNSAQVKYSFLNNIKRRCAMKIIKTIEVDSKSFTYKLIQKIILKLF